MSKGEYNKYIKEQQKEALEQKQHEYYNRVNNIIDYANKTGIPWLSMAPRNN